MQFLGSLMWIAERTGGRQIFRAAQNSYVTPSLLSALCIANEVAIAMEAGPEAETRTLSSLMPP